jgi:hypothetical protein
LAFSSSSFFRTESYNSKSRKDNYPNYSTTQRTDIPAVRPEELPVLVLWLPKIKYPASLRPPRQPGTRTTPVLALEPTIGQRAATVAAETIGRQHQCIAKKKKSMTAVELFEHYELHGYAEARLPKAVYANFDAAAIFNKN